MVYVDNSNTSKEYNSICKNLSKYSSTSLSYLFIQIDHVVQIWDLHLELHKEMRLLYYFQLNLDQRSKADESCCCLNQIGLVWL
jgi:hypothetical protein